MDCLPVFILLLPVVISLSILLTLKKTPRLHSLFSFSHAIVRIVLIGFAWWMLSNNEFQFKLDSTPLLQLDTLALQFLLFFSILWLIMLLYAHGYIKNSVQHSRFLAFSELCAAAATGIALSANLLVLLIFYELLALSVYALLMTENTLETQEIGKLYLRYMTLGSIILLGAVIWLITLIELQTFSTQNTISVTTDNHKTLLVIFLLLLTSFGIKAALIPFQRWLLRTANISVLIIALLCTLLGVQVGLFAILRSIFYLYSVEFIQIFEIMNLLVILAIATFIYSAVQALLENNLLKRLTWIAIGQGACTVLSLPLLFNMEYILLIFWYQGAFVLLLFLCVGNILKVVDIYTVSDLRGIGRYMPATMAMFTLGALGMLGLPVFWLSSQLPNLTLPYTLFLVIIISLEIAYLFQILYKSWLQKDVVEHHFQMKPSTTLLLAPWLIIAFILLVGLFVIFIGIN